LASSASFRSRSFCHFSRAKPSFVSTNGDQLDGDELFPAEQARIVALLIKRVDIGTDGLDVRLRVNGLSGLAREMLAGGLEAAA
jgi:hypothetical protein